MADADTVTLTRAEYENLIDARDHAIAMREVATGAMETLTGAEVEACLAAPKPLRFWRVHRGLTEAALAAAGGISETKLGNAEAGADELSVGTLARLARVLRVRMEDLVDDEQEVQRSESGSANTGTTTAATGATAARTVGADEVIPVVEEIGIRKEAADRIETVRDTVRRTEVEVDDQTPEIRAPRPRTKLKERQPDR